MTFRPREHSVPKEPSEIVRLLQEHGHPAWEHVRDTARRSPKFLTDAVLEAMGGQLVAAPRTFFALLLDIAARDPERRPGAEALFRRFLVGHEADALATAGYNLHEYCRLLSPEWIELAMRHVDANAVGAWGIVESAAMYSPRLLLPAHRAWFLAHGDQAPRSFFITLLSLVGSPADPQHELLGLALTHWPRHPGAAVDAAAQVVSSHRSILIPALAEAAVAGFAANAERSWDFFREAAISSEGFISEPVLQALLQRAEVAPGQIFSILGTLMGARPEAVNALLAGYAQLVTRHPTVGISAIKYTFQLDHIMLLRPSLIQALCHGFGQDAYAAYDILQRCIDRRPELIDAAVLEAAIANIEHATNYAFGFFTKLLKVRPEFTPECTLALFDCLAREPVNRAFMRAEEIETIIAISEAAPFRTALDQELRRRSSSGSRRARALMAIMFRHRLRALRHVLLEALRYAGTMVMTRRIPDPAQGAGATTTEKYSPIWDFLMYLIDQGGDDALSTAAAETFLEGMYQLQYLYGNDHERTSFIAKLDIGYPGEHPLPEALSILGSDRELVQSYAALQELSQRFSVAVTLGAAEEFSTRQERAAVELAHIRQELTAAADPRRRGLAERERRLSHQLHCWADATYRAAYHDAAIEASLPADDRAFLRSERKNLRKHLWDSLHAETQRVAVTAVERLRLELYRLRLNEYLGYEVDIAAIDAQVLPAFLWFGVVGNLPKNTRYLRRLIEDRLQHRDHAWLRTEPAAEAWSSRVRAAQPDIRLERWRAPFRKEIDYRKRDAAAERQARIRADLDQTRTLLERAGHPPLPEDADLDVLTTAAAQIGLRRAGEEEEGQEPAAAPRPAPVDQALMQEIAMNLERLRITLKAPESDYEGTIALSVESDPFEILFMGEYGFSSCLSLRGINAWSAVSNAIDIDKTIVWAREPGGNVVGRRLLALVPGGILTYHTYTNRSGLALDRLFSTFIDEYAQHCGTRVIHSGSPGPLLSDRWYDDGCL